MHTAQVCLAVISVPLAPILSRDTRLTSRYLPRRPFCGNVTHGDAYFCCTGQNSAQAGGSTRTYLTRLRLSKTEAQTQLSRPQTWGQLVLLILLSGFRSQKHDYDRNLPEQCLGMP